MPYTFWTDGNGFYLRDAQATPHYWKVTVTAAGALQTTDSGTSLPAGTHLTSVNLNAAMDAVLADASNALVFLVAAPTGIAATDTAAIQAKLAAANAAGGGVVRLQEGTYALNAALTMYSNVTLEGVGYGTALDVAANLNGVEGTSLTNITIHGIRFLGNGGTTDTADAIELTSCSRVRVKDCHFHDFAAPNGGGGVFSGCAQVIFAHNIGYDSGYALCNFHNCQAFTAIGNVHTNTRAASLLSSCCYANTGSVDGAFIGNVSNGDTWPFEVRVAAKRVTVTGNTIKGCKNQGIVVQATSANLVTDVIVADNVIDLASGATDGIMVDSTQGVTVCGNLIAGPCTNAGIWVTDQGTGTDGTETVLRGNTVRDSAEYGILVAADCARTQIAGNWIESTVDNRSINCLANDCLIEGNYVYDSGWHGIEASGTGYQIIGNRVNGTRNSGNGINATGNGGIVANNYATGVAATPFNITGTGIKRHGNRFSTGEMQGRAVLVGGTVTVTTGEVLANDNIHLTRVVTGGTVGHLTIGTITANTSFIINSSSATDTSTVFWEIIH